MYEAFLFYDFVFSKQVQTSLALFKRTRSLLKTKFLDFGVNCFFSSSDFFPSVERCMRIYIHLILMRSYYRTSYTHICVTLYTIKKTVKQVKKVRLAPIPLPSVVMACKGAGFVLEPNSGRLPARDYQLFCYIKFITFRLKNRLIFD